MARLNCCANCSSFLRIGFLLLTLIMENTHARIGYFWHITDLHLDTIYSTQGDVMRSCWRIERQPPSSSTHLPGRYGDYLCDSPWSLIESAAKAMKSRQGDNVEFVLWTGDGLSHSAHPMSEMKKLEILRNITDLLGRTFSSQFVFPVLGHEDGTTTNFRHMGELWRHWLPTEALHTFEKGGYYSIEQTKSRLRIIALNTNFMRHDPKYSQSHLAAVRQRMPSNSMNSGGSGSVSANGGIGSGGVMTSDSTEYRNYYYHHNNMHQHHGHAGDWSSSGHGYGYNSHHRGINVMPGGMHYNMNGLDGGGRVSALSEFENQDTEKQWIWLEEVLSKSKANKETVYIVGHIPPGSDERHIGLQQNGHTTFTESNNKRYLELVRKYSSIIQGQFFGHLHSDSFRIIYDDKGKPVSWMMISPSVTPRKMSVGSNNPAMRLYKFDTDSGQVLDYTQYYMDLQLANTLGEPNWVPEYNLTHYYALSDISAISLHNFVDRFTSNDASWFAKYYRANTVRYQTDNCEGVCMLNHYCAITRVDYKEFRQCLEKEQSALRSNARQQCANVKILLMVTTIMVLAITYLQCLYDFGQCMLRLINTACHQHCNAIRNYQFYTTINEIRIKLTKAFVDNMYEKEKEKEEKDKEFPTKEKTKDFQETQLYNVESIESQIYPLAAKQQQHNCGHCLQQRAMMGSGAPVDNANKTDKENKGIIKPMMMAKVNKRKYEISLKYKKKFNVIHTQQHTNNSNDLRLEYFKLISLLLLYSIKLHYLYIQYSLRLVQQYSIQVLSSKNTKSFTPLLRSTSTSTSLSSSSLSWIVLKSKCCWAILSSTRFFHNVLLISGVLI